MPALPPIHALKGRRIWVAGHRGMVGSACLRRLAREDCEILTVDRRSVDLRDQAAVFRWMMDARPQIVILAAARVGGILANDTHPARFLYDNLAIGANVIEGARRAGVERLLFLGSSCIYPRLAPQPMAESALLTGALEPTNEWYAIAKIAGVKLCQAYRREYGADFISAMPANLYGPNDNYDPLGGHAVAGLLRRMHEARRDGAAQVTVWGTGTPRREFLHVDDLADACVFLLERYSGEAPINVGSGADVSIGELAGLIRETVGFSGGLVFDPAKPDGAPRKLMDVTRLTDAGWTSAIGLREGLADAYGWYLRNVAHA
jgi:GDP-L-fucose synthase